MSSTNDRNLQNQDKQAQHGSSTQSSSPQQAGAGSAPAASTSGSSYGASGSAGAQQGSSGQHSQQAQSGSATYSGAQAGRSQSSGSYQQGGNQQNGGGALSYARNMAEDAAKAGTRAAAEQLHSVAGGIRKSAESMEGDRTAWVGHYMAEAAEGIDRFSRQLRENDIRQMVSSVDALARRHPVAFMAGCGVAGFLLARFLKSSAR